MAISILRAFQPSGKESTRICVCNQKLVVKATNKSTYQQMPPFEGTQRSYLSPWSSGMTLALNSPHFKSEQFCQCFTFQCPLLSCLVGFPSATGLIPSPSSHCRYHSLSFPNQFPLCSVIAGFAKESLQGCLSLHGAKAPDIFIPQQCSVCCVQPEQGIKSL